MACTRTDRRRRVPGCQVPQPFGRGTHADRWLRPRGNSCRTGSARWLTLTASSNCRKRAVGLSLLQRRTAVRARSPCVRKASPGAEPSCRAQDARRSRQLLGWQFFRHCRRWQSFRSLLAVSPPRFINRKSGPNPIEVQRIPVLRPLLSGVRDGSLEGVRPPSGTAGIGRNRQTLDLAVICLNDRHVSRARDSRRSVLRRSSRRSARRRLD